MTQERTVSQNVRSTYFISILVVISTVVLLRFVLAPYAQAMSQWTAESPAPTAPVVQEKPATASVRQQIEMSYLGKFGIPNEMPRSDVTQASVPMQPHVVNRPVQDEVTAVEFSASPRIQLASYRLASVPTLNDLGKMRVGITNELTTVELSANKVAEVETTEGFLLTTVPKNEVITITPETTGYSVITSTGIFSSSTGVRFVPHAGGIVTVQNYSYRPAWDTTLNDNTFRGRIVVARGTDDSTWVVNVLSLGAYVRGIGEASDSSPVEFQKALLVAARTYAAYNMEHQTKHAGEPYILDNTANDQVYLGHGLEKRSPTLAASARATTKQVLTYADDLIVAPYFSQSDGRTRSWSEVWGSEYPWAVSVEDPGCVGLALEGHGVGLSGTGAVYFANQGELYDQILEYYYTGVTLSTLN